MALVEQIRREYQRGPITFVAAAIGILSVFANALLYALSLSPRALQLLHSDAGLVLSLTAVILTQGTVAFVFSRTLPAILRLGVGFPILLVAVSILLMAWFLSFNAYWFADFGARASRLSTSDWYGIALAASWAPALYFQSISVVTNYDRKWESYDVFIFMYIVVCNFLFATFMAAYFLGRLKELA